MGTINLKHTGSGSDITLSSDGTDLLLDGTAIGGGGGGSPDLFADNWNGTSTQPSATGENAVALGYGSVSSGIQGMALGTRAVAYGSGNTTWGMVAFTDSYASGRHSLAGAIASGISSYGATGQGSVAFGQQSKATSSYATAIGMTCTASGSYSTAIGDNAVASHANGIAIGDAATTSATNQIALGGTTDNVKISGTYTLPTSDGTNGQVLTTDGSGAVTFADAGGGGGADLYAAETTGSTDPTATGTLSLAIGSSANGSGTNAVAIGNGAAAGTYSVGIGWNAGNTGSNNTIIGRTGSTAGTSGATVIGYNADVADYTSNQTALGYQAKTSSGAQATALTQSYASGANSFAAAIANNTSSYGATGSNSVAIGRLAKATGSHSLAIGGYNNFAAGAAAVSIGGNQANKAFGNASFCIGGWQAWNEATDDNSFAMGEGAKSAVKGKLAYAGGRFNIIGDAQGGQFILRADTTDATATALTTNNSTAGSTNQIVAASDTCITFDGTITAMQNGAQAYASWKIEGLLVNDGGTTTLANSATTAISNADGWGMALSADNTNNALAITVTGEASHNILWVANIRTTEVTYA